MKTIQEYKREKLKKYYGASKRVYQQSHVDRLLRMQKDLSYLGELFTRTRLVPANPIFRQAKAVPHYNSTLIIMQLRYPEIKEFQSYKPIKD